MIHLESPSERRLVAGTPPPSAPAFGVSRPGLDGPPDLKHARQLVMATATVQGGLIRPGIARCVGVRSLMGVQQEAPVRGRLLCRAVGR